MNRLEVTDLVVRYGTGRRALTAVDKVNLVVPQGGALGVVGESGCGKSTLARAIMGLVPIVSGGIHLDGVDFTTAKSRNSRDFRRRVQMVFQDPYASLNPRMTVGSAVGQAAALRGVVGRRVRRSAALHALELVGLDEAVLSRYPHQFSGGQRQRIAIARALAVQPEVIIADEITSALDVSVQATILNLLKSLEKETGVSLIVISHDLSVVRYMSNHVAVMYLGEVVEYAATLDLFERPQHPYTKALMKSIPKLGAVRQKAPLSGDLPDPHNPPSGCRFHTRCPMGPLHFPDRSICQEVDPHGIAHERVHLAACHFSAPSDGPSAMQSEQLFVTNKAAQYDVKEEGHDMESL
jgi:oligopeptide/dipeptide ABC transporter ATP-binding protein